MPMGIPAAQVSITRDFGGMGPSTRRVPVPAATGSASIPAGMATPKLKSTQGLCHTMDCP